MHHIDEFNFKMYKIFLRGGMPPDPPRGTEVHPPQSHKILWETLWRADRQSRAAAIAFKAAIESV